MSFTDWTWIYALWLLILVWSNTAGGCHSRYGIAPSRTTIHTGWFSSRQGHRTRLITGFNGSKSKQTSVSHGLVHISSSNHWQEVDAWLKQSKVRVWKREFWNCHCFINGNLICYLAPSDQNLNIKLFSFPRMESLLKWSSGMIGSKASVGCWQHPMSLAASMGDSYRVLLHDVSYMMMPIGLRACSHVSYQEFLVLLHFRVHFSIVCR